MQVLTRQPGLSLAQAELTYLERDRIDVALALKQHASYRQALAAVAGTSLELPELPGHADACFVEDVLLAFPELFVLTRPGAVSRQGEVSSVATALPTDRPQHRLQAPATLDGGDVLVIGKRVFVGLSTRTNTEAVSALQALLRRFGYQVEAVRVPGALHLKTAVTALHPDLVLINPAWVDREAFADYGQVEVVAEEPFAGNSLRIGQHWFMQTAHARTAEKVSEFGVEPSLLDISEFAKAEAGLTCLSVLIPEPC